MRFVFLLFLLTLALPVRAVDRITASIALTSGTTNGQTLTINGGVRTWTNNVVVTASQILTNSTAATAKTNLYNQLALNPPVSCVILDNGAANMQVVASSGTALTVTLSAGWGAVTYSTQSVTALTGVRVPIAGEASGGQQTNIASLLVKGESDLSTNGFAAGSLAMQNMVGLANAQTVTGVKAFTAPTARWGGTVSNSPSISGTVDSLTNGYWRNGKLASPSITNGVNYGTAFRSPGAGVASENFGTSALATGDNSVAFGASAFAAGASSAALGYAAEVDNDGGSALGQSALVTGDFGTAVGKGAAVSEPNATAVGYLASAGHANATAVGVLATTTAAHQLMLGTSSEYAHFPGNVRMDGNTELTWKRYANSSLANGNNAGVVVGTNTFVEVSGPSAAFTINGIAGGRDGKFLIIVNRTGYDMTVASDSGVDATAANRIYTSTGADRTTTGNGAATFIYSGAASRWINISFDP